MMANTRRQIPFGTNEDPWLYPTYIHLFHESIDAAKLLSRLWGSTPGHTGRPMHDVSHHRSLRHVVQHDAERRNPLPSAAGATPANTLTLSDMGAKLLKEKETGKQVRLTPYDDQTGKGITAWTKGATIGYGHLIHRAEWGTYKGGITLIEAETLFNKDFITICRRRAVQNSDSRDAKPIRRASPILAFNIGKEAFARSSVVKLVNNPNARTGYKNS